MSVRTVATTSRKRAQSQRAERSTPAADDPEATALERGKWGHRPSA
jgi:hypothetical protein